MTERKENMNMKDRIRKLEHERRLLHGFTEAFHEACKEELSAEQVRAIGRATTLLKGK